MLNCTKCGSDFINPKSINVKLIENDPERFLHTCKSCRLIRECVICDSLFKHFQNKTCSVKCSKLMKQKTSLKNNGSVHQFCKNSESRKKWENDLLINEGITNVFQRESVKDKIKNTVNFKYGVDNPSQSNEIKIKKKNTLKNTLKNNPNLYKDNWKKTHDKFITELGYDPRLHAIGKASIESLEVFDPLVEWCLYLGINIDDIYLGINDKKEFFLQTDKKLYFYDFCIRSKKIIIEFHGIAFHANPNDINVNEWKHPFTNQSYNDNIKQTEIKNKKAINAGFKLLEIWSDVDPLDNIEICKNFIKENI